MQTYKSYDMGNDIFIMYPKFHWKSMKSRLAARNWQREKSNFEETLISYENFYVHFKFISFYSSWEELGCWLSSEYKSAELILQIGFSSNYPTFPLTSKISPNPNTLSANT